MAVAQKKLSEFAAAVSGDLSDDTVLPIVAANSNKTLTLKTLTDKLKDSLALVGDALAPFVATGALTSRSVKDRFAEVANIRDFKSPSDPNWNLAFTRAIATGLPIEVPFSVEPYVLSQAIVLPDDAVVFGKGGRPIFKPTGVSSIVFQATGKKNIRLTDFIVDGSLASLSDAPSVFLTNCTESVVQRVRLDNTKQGFRFAGGSNNKLLDWEVYNSKLHAVMLIEGTTRNVVSRGFTKGNIGFGVIMLDASNKNEISFNTTTENGLELIGLTHTCFENRIFGNHVENVGDTGISVSGFLNTVFGNVVKKCAGNGIHIYGERNTVVGNTCSNNSQKNAENTLWRAGIAIQGGFGGAAQLNVVTGNTCDDDQAVPTQLHSVWIGAGAYEAWNARTWAAGRYCQSNGNIYQTTAGGTTLAGATAPSHTEGTQSDGAVSWTFVRRPITGAVLSDKNSVSANNAGRSKDAPYSDTSGAAGNEFAGLAVPLKLPSPLIVSEIANTAGVGSISLPGTGTAYQWNASQLNGVMPTVNIGAPQGAGQQATAKVNVMLMLGFGTIVGGTGYSVNDILTIQGGTPVQSATNLAAGAPRQIKVTAVDGNGMPTAYTGAGTSGTYYYTAPFPNNATLSGGTGTGAKLSESAWRLGAAPTIEKAGSGYSAAPVVTYAPAFLGSVVSVATLASLLKVGAGAGQVQFDADGTKLGVLGAAGKPVLSQGASVDASGVRVAVAASQNYAVPLNTSLVRLVQTVAVSPVTVTLPAGPIDGQVLQLVNYAGAISAFTFSPAVQGFSNGSGFNANSGIRIRFDAADGLWHREG